MTILHTFAFQGVQMQLVPIENSYTFNSSASENKLARLQLQTENIMATKKLTLKRKINSTVAKSKSVNFKPPVKDSKPKDGGFVVHQIRFQFVGTSKPYGVHKNRTPLRVERFGSIKGAILSERDHNLLKNIKAVYGAKPFVRGDYDAGALSRLGERGYLKLVSGQPNSVNSLLQLHREALA